MKKLSALINELETFIPEQELLNAKISAGSIGWHIEHSLLTVNLVVEHVIKSDPQNYKPGFHFWKLVILVFKKLPRGKVKAPKSVRPKNDHTNESLTIHIAIARANLENLKTLHKNQHFHHPFLGLMNLKETIKFLEIHTSHHLQIIKEIKVLSPETQYPSQNSI